MTSATPGREVHLDVRADIRRGEEPFGRIMGAVDGLGPDDVLVLRAPFEPVPLYRVLGRGGFEHRTECRAPDDWWVWFRREARPAGKGTADPPDPVVPGASQTPLRIDVRGLEPPLPMTRILESLERLAPDQALEVLHERRPIFLYPQLEDRGFAHATDEPEPGLVRIVIRRAEALG